jgi:aryl-alcohol dehydrogenase-like predicted oxidoreductase
LGTAPLAFKNVSVDQAIATVRAAVDGGVDVIDTALAYTRPGVESFAEAVVAQIDSARSHDQVSSSQMGGS